MYTIRQPTECLLNNYIDKDLQAALRPFIILRKIFLLSNFSIISNFITPNYAVFHIKPVIGALLLMVTCYYRWSIHRHVFYEVDDHFISKFFLFVEFIHIFISIAVLYIVNVMQSSNFVLLIVKLQYALNAIDLDRERTMFNLKLWNWIYIIGIISFNSIYILFGLKLHHIGFIHQLLIHIPFFVFELQIVQVSRFVQMLSGVLRLWHKKMISHKNDNDELSGNKMLHAYKNILQSFHIIEKFFCCGVSIHNFALLFNLNIVIQYYLYTNITGFAFDKVIHGKKIIYDSFLRL